jgi:hypothetical protein
MTSRGCRALLLAIVLVGSCGLARAADDAPGVVHHELEVRLEPAAGRLEVLDTITLNGAVAADAEEGYRFTLHAGLAPAVRGPGWRLEAVSGAVDADFLGLNASSESTGADVPLEGWRLIPDSDDAAPVVLAYAGTLAHPIETAAEDYQRSFSETPGLIEERGVFLAGTSYWIPDFGDGLLTFSLTVRDLTPPWDVVSQGQRSHPQGAGEGSRTTVWTCSDPTEEVYLVAGPWHEYTRRAGRVEIMAFLRADDPALAARYLDATARYLKLYHSMLPAFPFASFALVENFWETGYGMPGFTLLGPRVIRFPWILTSSYPHELLHNWWGNGVYVNFEEGNWCEGLTAYMADHLFAEQRGDGALHRRSTLKKYADFVSTGNDFPLRDFRSRRSAATEAVGYGKSLMLFHMLRRNVGDEAFLDAMSHLARQHLFQRASFSDIASAIGEVASGDWQPFVAAWSERSGAPHIALEEVRVERVERHENPWQLHLTIRQTQAEDPFPLSIPVAVTLAGQEQAVWLEGGTCGRVCELAIPCGSRPLRLDVDPEFDVMRRLDPMEVPPALSTVFGADSALFVLPTAAAEGELAAWRALAAAWAHPETPQMVFDSELEALPSGPLWVLGWDNRFAPAILSRLEPHRVARQDDMVTIGEQTVPTDDHSLVLMARDPEDPAAAAGWVAADPPDAIAGLARKLPHYSRYSYLGFRGDEPANMAKGLWPAISSPLVRNLGDGPLPPLNLPPRRPLRELPAVYDGAALAATVSTLAGAEMEGRGLGSKGLDRATDWVEARLAASGARPAGDNGFRSTWAWHGGEPARELKLTNLVAAVPGSDPELAPLLVTAHLDHLGRGWPDVRDGNQGQIHPGADDNASGVAVLLELARTMAAEPPRARSVLFAVVTGEEAGRLGSRRLLAGLGDEQRPFACLNLDTVGRLGDGKLMVLGADSAREWRFIFMGVGYTTGAPIAVVNEPLDASDQASCHELGIPAVQLFSGPHDDYHRPGDTADKIDADGLATVTEASHEALAYLADRREPLLVTIGAATPPPAAAAGTGERRASLGTMPDFTHQGPGVRVQQVMPDSAAAAAGIRAGDTILAIDDEGVADLRSYSAMLKAHQPGDTITLTVERGEQRLELQATLKKR